MSNNSYSQYVESIAHQFSQLAPHIAPIHPLAKPTALSSQPRILILSPHPDDECLMAGCALRMQEEWGAMVTVVPYSYGSNPARRTGRLQELKDALGVLKFQYHDPRVSGLEKLTRAEFLDAVKTVNPEIIISPHAGDLHPTHVEAHELVADYWMSVKGVIWIQTEYWQQAASPNAMIPLSENQVIRIGEALMKHAGEIARNPYHLSLPAWFMDQARRGPEVISGFSQNQSAPIFAQLITIK